MKKMTAIALTTTLTSLVAFNSHAITKPSTGGTGVIQDISVGDVGSQPVIVVRNISVNKQLGSINLQPQSNTIQMKLKGDVECGGVFLDSIKSKVGYSFKSARLGVGPEQSAYWDVAAGSSSNINKSGHIVTKTLNVPIADFVGTAHEIDVAELVMQMANQHAQNGGNKVTYLQQDHNYSVQVPIRFAAECQKYTRNKISKKTTFTGIPGLVSSKMINVRVAYKGDKNLIGNVLQAANNSPAQQGGYAANQQNFIDVNSGKFLIGPKKLKGKCALEPDFKIELTGAGDGDVKLRINDDGNTIHHSPVVAFNSGKATYSFKKKVGQFNENILNKTYDHEYQVYIKVKTKNETSFPTHWQPVSGAALNWEHTCIRPVVVNPIIRGGTPTNKLDAPTKPGRGPLKKK